ncbi:MAG: MOSC domain-containing protein [Chthoniobacterales bacterium]
MAAPDLVEPPEWEAELRHIFTSLGHDYWGKKGEGRMQHGIQSLTEVECVAGMGLRGDRYFNVRPDARGQVTFIDAAVVEEARLLFDLPKLPASVFRRNLVVAGASPGEWIGRRFRLQGITFEGAQECFPCVWMDRVVAPGTQAYMKPNLRGGLRAKIITSGILRVG